MKGVARFKVPKGKLIEVKIDYGQSINQIQILGDFFFYPGEKLKEIESSLVGLDINENEESISGIISKVVKKNSITMVGITPKDVAKTIKMAVSK